MGKLLESALIAQYKEIEKDLRSLNFSTYESAVYTSLLGKNKAITVREITSMCEKMGREVPVTKIYSVLNDLEEKGLVEKTDKPLRYSARFGKKNLESYIQQQVKEKEEQNKKEITELSSNFQKVWKETLSQVRKNYDIWKIYTKEEAQKLSLSMCKNAEKEIRIMTEHGGWIYNDDEFREVLQEKSKEDGMKIWALIADEAFIERGRENEWKEFKNFLEENKITPYFYEPRALRMTVVDRKESLFFMYRDIEQKEDPLIYYTALPDVSYSLSGFFNMACLFEYKDKLKSFIESTTNDKKFCELQNLLFNEK